MREETGQPAEPGEILPKNSDVEAVTTSESPDTGGGTTAEIDFAVAKLKKIPVPSWQAIRLPEQYEVLGLLGSGGMGLVLSAKDLRLDRYVAIKVMRASLEENRQKRFLREAQALAKLRHRNIVAIHEVGLTEDSALPYFSMERVPGSSLQALIDAAGESKLAELTGHDLLPPSPGAIPHLDTKNSASYIDSAVRLVAAIASALHTAHVSTTKIIHRDVKPANILVQPDGTAFLVDFGIAQTSAEGTLTLEQHHVGTPPYMAPEQIRGDRVDARTDVWGLGATLYQVLTLQLPFHGEGIALEQLILEQMPVPPNKHHALIPADLSQICLKALEKDPRDRYQTAGAMQEDLERFLRREPVRARPIGRLTRLGRAIRNRPRDAVLKISVAALLVGSPTALYLLEQSARKRVEEQKNRAELASSEARAQAILASAATVEANKQAAASQRAQRAAEKQRRLAQLASAKNAFSAARLAAQRGKWRESHAFYEAAEQLGYPDQVAIAIGRIEAYEGQYDIRAAMAVLDRLRRRPDLGRHRAMVLLLDGDLKVHRLLNPDHKLDLLRQAKALGGLTPANEAYVDAMLCTSAVEAITHLRRGLHHDSYNRRVNGLYILLLALNGRTAEAAAAARTATAMYPKDPAFHVLSGMFRALLGEAVPKIAPGDPRYNPRIDALQRNVMRLVPIVKSFDGWFARTFGPNPEDSRHAKSVLRNLASLVREFLGVLAARQDVQYFRVWPHFARLTRRLVLSMPAYLVFVRRPLLETLGQMRRDLGDSVFATVEACELGNQSRFEAAERLLRDHCDRPSMILTRATRRCFLLGIQAVLYENSKAELPERAAALRQRGMRAIRTALGAEHLSRDELRLLGISAFVLEDFRAGQSALLRRHLEFPGDREAQNLVTGLVLPGPNELAALWRKWHRGK